MIVLDFYPYPFKIRKGINGDEIFDIVRKKYVALTDEEWVRQHCLIHLIHEKSYPASLIAVEKGLKVNTLNKRADIVVFAKDMKAKLIVECKAPHIEITNEVFEQIARYNIALKVSYLMVTNGFQHYCCKINHENGSFIFLNGIPDYKEII